MLVVSSTLVAGTLEEGPPPIMLLLGWITQGCCGRCSVLGHPLHGTHC